MLAKFSGVESKRAINKFRKRKNNFFCFVSCRSRGTSAKKCTEMLLLFCRSRCRHRRRC